jgi:hypothetical protein
MPPFAASVAVPQKRFSQNRSGSPLFKSGYEDVDETAEQ